MIYYIYSYLRIDVRSILHQFHRDNSIECLPEHSTELYPNKSIEVQKR